MSDSCACAAALIAQLCAQGLTDLVLAPGSRSAPLALAAHRAEQEGLLRLHVRTDERSAGFLALGLAKGSGRAVAVVTTSGTAVGNLLPAVLEAHHAGVPLLVLSADRPAALVGFGANQTTDQPHLFADFVRYAARVSSAAPAASWPAQAARAWVAASGGRGGAPGPAHLNVELAEPLVGPEPPAWPQVTPVRLHAASDARPLDLPTGRRTILVCGDASVEVGREVAALAERARLPLVAEPSSNARAGGAALRTGRLLLSGDLAGEVERVVVFGHPTLSRPVSRLLARADVDVVVVSPTGDWTDPGWRARTLATAVRMAPDDGAWLRRWQEADQILAEALERRLAGATLSGPSVAAAVMAATGADVLVLGSSNPIRDADLAPIPAGDGPRVFANRGLAGIDGTVSTACGVALALGAPTWLLCGDLTFLHDGNGLAAGLGERRPDLRIVVADDGGGSIFATLEYGAPEFAEAFERVFATPSGVDLVALARAHGLPAVRVGDAAGLAEALARPVAGLDVVVVALDRAGRRDLTEAL